LLYPGLVTSAEAEREVPVLDAICNVILPLPVPLVADVVVTQLGKPLRLQGQVEPAVICRTPTVADALKLKLVGERTGAVGQTDGLPCAMLIGLFPKENDAVRLTPLAFSAAEKLITMLPEAGMICGPVTLGNPP
jgi:hypothetical protein